MRAGGYDGEIHKKQENGEGRLQLVFVAVLGASMRNCVCKGKSRAETNCGQATWVLAGMVCG